MLRHAVFLMGVIVAVTGQPTSSKQGADAGFTDPRDGNAYPMVNIAGMTWMGRNLDHAVDGSACLHGDAQACAREGRLYPWTAAMTACPSGWHLSTEDEWQRLERALGMPEEDLLRDRERGPGLGDLLKIGGSTGLDFPLAGWRRPDGTFRVGNGADRATAIWTATRVDEDAAWHRDLSSAHGHLAQRGPARVQPQRALRQRRPLGPPDEIVQAAPAISALVALLYGRSH